MPPNPAVSGWRVTSQVEGFGQNERGQAVEGVRVYFTTGKGHNGSVFVPRDRYNPDNVRAAVLAAVAMYDEVGGLKG